MQMFDTRELLRAAAVVITLCFLSIVVGFSMGAQPPRATAPPAAVLPDPALTPGDVLPVDAADVCSAGYAGRVRNVPASIKRDVYAAYGIAHHQPGEYEVDHLISLELGGSNSPRNLWPEAYAGLSGAHVKDRVENRLHGLVCAHRLELGAAQRAIAQNWVLAYHEYVPDTAQEQ